MELDPDLSTMWSSSWYAAWQEWYPSTASDIISSSGSQVLIRRRMKISQDQSSSDAKRPRVRVTINDLSHRYADLNIWKPCCFLKCSMCHLCSIRSKLEWKGNLSTCSTCKIKHPTRIKHKVFFLNINNPDDRFSCGGGYLGGVNISWYLAGTQLLLQELGRPGADALQDQLVLRHLGVRGLQKLQQGLGVVEMPLDRAMEAGLAAELGQRICTTLCFQFGDSDTNASKFLNEIKPSRRALAAYRTRRRTRANAGGGTPSRMSPCPARSPRHWRARTCKSNCVRPWSWTTRPDLANELQAYDMYRKRSCDVR